ncbi:hypothetical protein D2E23_1577 [Bifidobacterium callimiconis]|uniref:Uncharacterized protein n=1 Tax=Bifidobacterium callimiconis TaxID=2306973 RepID=A0A430FCI5_9BIFI|nr:hypothetical protein D2E23_1577 [Bifidobacterium callimiconis]
MGVNRRVLDWHVPGWEGGSPMIPVTAATVISTVRQMCVKREVLWGMCANVPHRRGKCG